jgi:hypothetical protein
MGTSSTAPPLLPREHGAYVQLGLALACGVVLGHGHVRSWSQAVLTFSLFLSSGPVLLLLGRSGAKVPAAAGRRAQVLLASLGLLALLAAKEAWWAASPGLAWSLLAPSGLAAILAVLVLAKREHSTLGELVAAWALSSSAYPAALLGGAGSRRAAMLALTLAAVHTLGTSIVRAFLQSLKPGRRALSRGLPPLLGLLLMILGITFDLPYLALALTPGTLLAIWMLVRPLPPRHMKRLGWLLTAASAAGLLPMLLSLR